MQTTIAVVIDVAEDGQHCGNNCATRPLARGGYKCHVFDAVLECPERELGSIEPAENPLRCADCISAERNVRKLAFKRRRNAAPDIENGGRGNWRKELRRQPA